MKFRSFIALMLAPVWILSAEPATNPPQSDVKSCHQAPHAWLGLRISKPDEAITVHVPSLPPGVGFVVDSVDVGGPAESAGLRALDLLWKIGDQMLVNEAQLATLLRLAKPGDEVVLSGFRAGKPLQIKLTLGEAPPRPNPFGGEFAEAAIMPDACAGPMRVVNVSEKIASFTADEGTATVQRDGSVFKVRINGPGKKPLYDGELARDGGMDAIPVDWRRKIQVLCRTLDLAIAGAPENNREPRPRVVPPSGESR